MTDHIPPQQELETFLPDEFYEAEYKLQNRIRVTTNVKDFTTEVYTGLRWIPVTEYVEALLAQTRTDTIREVEEQHQVEVLQVRIDEIGRHPSRGDSLKYYQRRKKQLEAQLEQLKGQK